MSKDSDKQVEQATKEIQAVCEKHKVDVVAYIHSLGPRLAIVPADAQQTNSQTRSDENGGGKSPKSDDQSVRPVAKTVSDN